MSSKMILTGLAILLAGGPAAGQENLSAEALLPGHEATQAHAPVAVFGKDVYLVVWEAGWNEKADIVGIRLDKAGKPLDAKPFVIAAARDCQERPRIAWGSGVFLVVWQDLRNGKDYDVYAARVSPDGKVLDPDGIAVSAEKHNQAQPAVCSDGANFQLLWRDMRSGQYEIYGGRVSPEGKPLDGAGVLVQTYFLCWNGAQIGTPGLGSNGAGVLVGSVKGYPNGRICVWPMQGGKQAAKPQDPIKGWDKHVFEQTFASDGQNLLMCIGTFRPISRGGSGWDGGAALLASNLTTSKAVIAVSSVQGVTSLSCIRNPAPAWDGTSYVVAWDIFVRERDAKTGRNLTPCDVVFLRRISRDGVPQGENLPVAGEQDSPALHPAAASDGAGTTVIAYERHPKTADQPIKIGVRVLTAK